MKYKTVLFDLDGTLLNTLQDLCNSVNFALKCLGFPKRSLDEIRAFVGNGVVNLISLAVPENTSEALKSECLSLFRTHYNANMDKETSPYPGILPLLERLKDLDMRIAVISNKYDAAVKALCKKYFGDLIVFAYGASNERRNKPAPDIVFKALEDLDSNAQNALYIGDSDVDITCAANAGVDSVGVTWGFRDAELLKKAGANYIIDTPSELLKLLNLI